jgi:anti-sigma B factor antagonist
MADSDHAVPPAAVSQAATGTVVVAMPAEIDMSNANGVGSQLYAALDSGAVLVIADLTGTVYCDSTGMRNLLLAHRNATALGVELRLAVQADQVLRVMELMAIPDIMGVYPTVQAALSAPRN